MRDGETPFEDVDRRGGPRRGPRRERDASAPYPVDAWSLRLRTVAVGCSAYLARASEESVVVLTTSD